jgi:hypothetical protein
MGSLVPLLKRSQVELTEGSSFDPKLSMLAAQHRVRLTQECVKRLREYCSLWRSELFEKGGSDEGEGGGSAEESEEEEETDEESEGEEEEVEGEEDTEVDSSEDGESDD